MPQSKRSLQATAALTTSPPSALPAHHAVARVTRLAGNNLYQVEFGKDGGNADPAQTLDQSVTQQLDAEEQSEGRGASGEGLVELPSRFRNAIWLKRGSYVVVDTAALRGRDNKLRGEIVNVVREEKAWRKMAWWPKEFVKKDDFPVDDSDEEENVVGKMPPSDESDVDD